MRRSYLSNRRSKGQWFLISTVMVSITFLLISTLFEQYFTIDTSSVARMDEDFYLREVEYGLNRTVAIADFDTPLCENLTTKLDEFEQFSRERLYKMGYLLYVKKDIYCNQRRVDFGILVASDRMIVYENVNPVDVIPIMLE